MTLLDQEANTWAETMIYMFVDMTRKPNADERVALVQEYKDLKKHFEGDGWHNIKDNPQDLPTEDGQYLIYEIQYGEPWYDVAYFVTGANVFGTGHEKVIAWRELPKYEG